MTGIPLACWKFTKIRSWVDARQVNHHELPFLRGFVSRNYGMKFAHVLESAVLKTVLIIAKWGEWACCELD
jgi:hypothetical protein